MIANRNAVLLAIHPLPAFWQGALEPCYIDAELVRGGKQLDLCP